MYKNEIDFSSINVPGEIEKLKNENIQEVEKSYKYFKDNNDFVGAIKYNKESTILAFKSNPKNIEKLQECIKLKGYSDNVNKLIQEYILEYFHTLESLGDLFLFIENNQKKFDVSEKVIIYDHKQLIHDTCIKLNLTHIENDLLCTYSNLSTISLDRLGVPEVALSILFNNVSKSKSNGYDNDYMYNNQTLPVDQKSNRSSVKSDGVENRQRLEQDFVEYVYNKTGKNLYKTIEDINYGFFTGTKRISRLNTYITEFGISRNIILDALSHSVKTFFNCDLSSSFINDLKIIDENGCFNIFRQQKNGNAIKKNNVNENIFEKFEIVCDLYELHYTKSHDLEWHNGFNSVLINPNKSLDNDESKFTEIWNLYTIDSRKRYFFYIDDLWTYATRNANGKINKSPIEQSIPTKLTVMFNENN